MRNGAQTDVFNMCVYTKHSRRVLRASSSVVRGNVLHLICLHAPKGAFKMRTANCCCRGVCALAVGARRWATNGLADVVVAVAAAAAANTFLSDLRAFLLLPLSSSSVERKPCTPKCTPTPTLKTTTCGGELHAYESCAAVNAETHCAIMCVCWRDDFLAANVGTVAVYGRRRGRRALACTPKTT